MRYIVDYSLKLSGYIYLQARVKNACYFRHKLKLCHLKFNETIVFQG